MKQIVSCSAFSLHSEKKWEYEFRTHEHMTAVQASRFTNRMKGKNYITLTFLNIIQNVHGSVPEKEITFEARRGFNHDSTSKTVQHRLLCPVLSIRTGVTNSFFHLKQTQV